MPSTALQSWSAARSIILDEVEAAHRLVRGSGSGLRQVAQQINQAYAVLLSSQFQGFCRDLHTECANHLVASVSSPDLRAILLTNVLSGRKLDSGNPTPGNIGADFKRLGLLLWRAVEAVHSRNTRRHGLVEELIRWRNAIAHNEFAADMLHGGRPRLTLAEVQDWRRACEGLAHAFDGVLHTHLLHKTGTAPW